MEVVIFVLFGVLLVSVATMVTLILAKPKIKNTGEKNGYKEQKPMNIDPESIKLVEKHYLKKKTIISKPNEINTKNNSMNEQGLEK